MFKLVLLYRRVDAPDKVDQAFASTHLPLAEQLPGLRRRAVSHILGKPGGESRYYLMLELLFESSDAYVAALASGPGQALLQAVLPWQEARIVTWFYGEMYEEAMPAG